MQLIKQRLTEHGKLNKMRMQNTQTEQKEMQYKKKMEDLIIKVFHFLF